VPFSPFEPPVPVEPPVPPAPPVPPSLDAEASSLVAGAPPSPAGGDETGAALQVSGPGAVKAVPSSQVPVPGESLASPPAASTLITALVASAEMTVNLGPMGSGSAYCFPTGRAASALVVVSGFMSSSQLRPPRPRASAMLPP